jgi:ribonuclease HI
MSFADDVGWWVSGKDIAEVRQKLEKCASLSQEWAQKNTVIFDINKTEAALLSRKRKHKSAVNVGIQIAPGIFKPFNQQATRWLGIWLDSRFNPKDHHHKMMPKAYRAAARIRSLRGKVGLSPENGRKIQVAAVQAVALYGAELWWDETRNTGRTDDIQKLVNRQSRSITGMLRTTPTGPLVKEAWLRPADSLLANRQRRYATRAFELPEGNPLGDGVRNSSDVKSIFGRLSRSAKTDLQHQFSGLEVIETTRIPPSIESIAASVIIESREAAENTAVSLTEPNTRCLWTDGSRDQDGNVGAAIVWQEQNEWTGLKYRNKEVFDAELYAILRATVMARDQASELKSDGFKRIVIFSDSQAALSQIKHNGSGPGQTWASAIIQNSNEILSQNIQLEYRWVPRHAGIEGNETADQFAKDAAVPENEEELPSEEDRCTSLSHLRRCTTDAKWKPSDEWFVRKCRSRKYYRLDDHHKPNRVISKTEKSTAQIYYQIKTGHALIGPHLKRIKKSEDDTCWWCNRGVVQSREHLFKYCQHWRIAQNELWRAVKQACGRGRRTTSIKDLFGDRRCSEPIIQFLRSTEIGRRFRERGLEEDDPGG